MKKIILFTLIAALSLCLFACGSKTDDGNSDNSVEYATVGAEAVRADFEKAEKYVDGVLDAKNMVTSIQDDGDGAIYKYWTIEGDAENVPLSKEIEIAGNKIEIGTTSVRDLSSFDLDVSKSEETVKPGEVASLTLTKDNKYCNVISLPNDTDKDVPADDLTTAEVMTAAKDFSLSFSYSGVTGDSSLKDVLNALGTPNLTATLTSEDTGVSIELNYNNQEKDGDKTVSYSVIIHLVYDAQSDTATVDNIDVREDIYTEEDSAQE